MIVTVILSLIYTFVLAPNAFAYLDPGTGSYILQLLIASMVGVLFSVKIFWTRIKEFVKGIFGKKEDDRLK